MRLLLVSSSAVYGGGYLDHCAGAIATLLLFQLVSLPRPMEWHNLVEYWHAFQVDDNADLLEWVRTELPPSAVMMPRQIARPRPTPALRPSPCFTR